jgi:hypothetical protein
VSSPSSRGRRDEIRFGPVLELTPRDSENLHDVAAPIRIRGTRGAPCADRTGKQRDRTPLPVYVSTVDRSSRESQPENIGFCFAPRPPPGFRRAPGPTPGSVAAVGPVG